MGRQSGHRRAGLRAVVVGLLSVAFLCVAPVAHADSLGSQETAKQNQITQNAATIQKNKDALDVAANALQASQQQLAAAQADLAVKQQAVAAAQAQDDEMAANLVAAQATLSARQDDVAAAQAAVAKGEADLAAQKDQIGLIAQTTAQQNTTLLSLSMLLTGGFDTGDINNQVQWASAVFTANEDAMQQLETVQAQLVSAQAAAQQAEAAAAQAEAVVETQKAATAAQLAITQQAQAAAADAAANVAAKVKANQQAQATAQAALQQAQAQQTQMMADLANIQAQIQAEIKAQQEQAAAAAKAQQEAAAKAQQQASTTKTTAPASPPAAAAPSNSQPGAKALAAVSWALKQVGKAYVWGGTGPNGYDCSGLVMMAYRQVGISLPRGAIAQSQTGTYVSRANLQPGDLVFFYTPVEHVGMYVGNGMMVDASDPSVGVILESINSSFRLSVYNSARRVA